MERRSRVGNKIEISFTQGKIREFCWLLTSRLRYIFPLPEVITFPRAVKTIFNYTTRAVIEAAFNLIELLFLPLITNPLRFSN